jgi:hypothetical protein
MTNAPTKHSTSAILTCAGGVLLLVLLLLLGVRNGEVDGAVPFIEVEFDAAAVCMAGALPVVWEAVADSASALALYCGTPSAEDAEEETLCNWE